MTTCTCGKPACMPDGTCVDCFFEKRKAKKR